MRSCMCVCGFVCLCGVVSLSTRAGVRGRGRGEGRQRGTGDKGRGAVVEGGRVSLRVYATPLREGRKNS